MNSEIKYSVEENLDTQEFLEVLVDSSLGERRPIDDYDRIERMVRNANLIVTARIDGKLVGVARSISDFTYCTYLSDIAVKLSYQKRGIGKELIRLTKQISEPAKLILLSAPAAIEYYPKIGMTKHNYCFVLDDVTLLK